MTKIRILLVENHTFVREAAREIIKREPDMEVVGETSDGLQAVQLTGKFKPDIVIMDVVMPNMDGVEATKQLKAKYPNTSILILTADEEDQYLFALLDAKVSGYLLKTVSVQELLSAIRAISKGESVLQPSIARKVVERYHVATRYSSKGMIGPLTRKEMDVLRLAAKGRKNKEIAEELNLKVQTVRSRLKKVFKKLGVRTRTEAVTYAIRKGWVSLHDLHQK